MRGRRNLLTPTEAAGGPGRGLPPLPRGFRFVFRFVLGLFFDLFFGYYTHTYTHLTCDTCPYACDPLHMR